MAVGRAANQIVEHALVAVVTRAARIERAPAGQIPEERALGERGCGGGGRGVGGADTAWHTGPGTAGGVGRCVG